MASSKAETVEDFLAELPNDRSEALKVVRDVVVKNLPDGYQEVMRWGMICYEVPLETFADTYNKKPLQLAALASQKNYMSLYLSAVYADEALKEWFVDAYIQTGKKLDMGKSCIRFKSLEQLPVEVVGEVIAKTPLEQFLSYQQK